MWTNPQFPADLVVFTEEILNGKLRFCAGYSSLRLRSFSSYQLLFDKKATIEKDFYSPFLIPKLLLKVKIEKCEM